MRGKRSIGGGHRRVDLFARRAIGVADRRAGELVETGKASVAVDPRAVDEERARRRESHVRSSAGACRCATRRHAQMTPACCSRCDLVAAQPELGRRTCRGCVRRARRPAHAISPGVSDKRGTTLCIRTVPRSPFGHIDEQVARLPVRIALDVGHGLHRHRRQRVAVDDRAGSPPACATGIAAAICGVELVRVLDAGFVRCEPRILEEMTEPVGLQEPLRHLRRGSAHRDVAAVARRIAAARAGVLRTAAVALAQPAERLILRRPADRAARTATRTARRRPPDPAPPCTSRW